MPKIMKIGWQLTKLLQKLSGLIFLARPVYTFNLANTWTFYVKKNLALWKIFGNWVGSVGMCHCTNIFA